MNFKDIKINIVYCENDEEYDEIVSLLCRRYKDTQGFSFREISDTILLPDKKWIVAYAYQMKMLVRNAKEPVKTWSMQLVKQKLFEEGKVEFYPNELV